jgi:bud site selection protein 20
LGRKQEKATTAAHKPNANKKRRKKKKKLQKKMGRYAGSRTHHSHGLKKTLKTKRTVRMIDQIWEETRPEKVEKVMAELTKFDEDKPGLGQYYCISCARYFQTKSTLDEHFRTKSHKKRYPVEKKNVHSVQKHAHQFCSERGIFFFFFLFLRRPRFNNFFRLKQLKEKPYSTEDANLPVDNGKKSQPPIFPTNPPALLFQPNLV